MTVVKVNLLILLAVLAVISAGRMEAQPAPAAAQPGGLQLESLGDFLKENIDPDVLAAMQQLDRDKVERLFSELGQAMSGTNIMQLATLRETASQMAPLLKKFEETAPYGEWLQTRLDELEAADEWERALKSAASKRGARAVSSATSLKLERSVWARRLENRPPPPQAKTYVPQLKEVFVAEGMPPELVWLAEVESSFNADAKSPAGAAGLFQLMPETAKARDLSLWPWDERLQAEKSARAAARELRSLYNQYGNWQLTLAAYNAGQGRVNKLLKGKKEKNFDGIAARLPAETQMYVPKVEATILRREGRELQSLKLSKL